MWYHVPDRVSSYRTVCRRVVTFYGVGGSERPIFAPTERLFIAFPLATAVEHIPLSARYTCNRVGGRLRVKRNARADVSRPDTTTFSRTTRSNVVCGRNRYGSQRVCGSDVFFVFVRSSGFLLRNENSSVLKKNVRLSTIDFDCVRIV